MSDNPRYILRELAQVKKEVKANLIIFYNEMLGKVKQDNRLFFTCALLVVFSEGYVTFIVLASIKSVLLF